MNMSINKPLKLLVAEMFGNGEQLDAKGVHELVASYYPDERYCSPQMIQELLLSLRAVGILHEEGSYVDDSGELVSVYRISEYGLDKLHKAQ
ncbi:hypothetical protein D0S45_06160 [Marinifilum sp. JC120]|nr:hypothetical protein D0S45_06160 [Marinifilum sp. JC120]